MSTQSAVRKRPQKHGNKTKWDSTKFKSDEAAKKCQSVIVTNCCQRCTEVIQWKLDYGKYKPLKAPSKCHRCSEKRVKSAYHTLCTPCVEKHSACAKCGKAESEVVNTPELSKQEELKIEAELNKLLKLLPERKRRTVQRRLQQKERAANKKPSEIAEGEEEEGDLSESATVEDRPESLAQAKLEILKEVEALVAKFGKGNQDDLFDDLDDLDLSDDE